MRVHTLVMSTGPQPHTRVIVFRLAQLLEEKGWTPYRLAKESGIPQPTVYRLLSERGETETRIALKTLDTLCDTLECTVGELLEHIPAKKRAKGR
jgi:DNA-binding Xre family transcriptional regulator